ncbi:hypothetical protein DPMN_084246 [Dreissena polymorpha]|uniref:Uncharacterized protein n=1 Tax=Dreissena polymorpha TaxID=45954 RepID=A0A9D3YEI5_DREPO|nr:hypothetical protein DPMN_084246 [Dreissena polymorpha]
MAKKKWAQMNMADLVRFMGDVCDPEIKDIASESVNYLSSTSVTELINTLSEFMERKVLEELRKETFTRWLMKVLIPATEPNFHCLSGGSVQRVPWSTT